MIAGKLPSELYSEVFRDLVVDAEIPMEEARGMALLKVLDLMDREYSKKISSASDPRNWSER